MIFVDRIEGASPKSINSLWLIIKTADRGETYCSSLTNAVYVPGEKEKGVYLLTIRKIFYDESYVKDPKLRFLRADDPSYKD